jgi:hypothetical protein
LKNAFMAAQKGFFNSLVQFSVPLVFGESGIRTSNGLLMHLLRVALRATISE